MPATAASGDGVQLAYTLNATARTRQIAHGRKFGISKSLCRKVEKLNLWLVAELGPQICGRCPGEYRTCVTSNSQKRDGTSRL